MNKHGDSALIPKSPDAVAISDFRNGRVLSAMVTDALVLAKTSPAAPRVPSVLITGFPNSRWPVLQQAIIQAQWGDQINVTATDGEDPMEISNRLAHQLVDLLILNVTKDAGRESAEKLLGQLAVQASIPVVVRDQSSPGHQRLTSPWGSLESPIGEGLLGTVLKFIGHLSSPPARSEVRVPWRRWRFGPRIVMLDDLKEIHEMLDPVFRSWFPTADILHFTNAEAAYNELMRESPDLFTQDVVHGDPDGDEILRRLTEKDIMYPIFVMSAVVRKKEQLRPDCLGSNLDVTLLPKPFQIDELFWEFLNHVGISDQR